MSKKKIVIFGPIGDIGGREVEVNIIAKAIEDDYDVRLLSAANMTNNSFALEGLKNTIWNSIPKTLYNNNLVLKLFSKFSKLKSKGKSLDYFYCNNSLAKKVFNYNKLQLQVIENEIKEADLVLSCVQLTTQFLPEIVSFCKKNAIPCLVRTTGTIRKIDLEKFYFLKDVSLFLHHSEVNAKNLNSQINLPYEIVDQCANNEEKLLRLPVKVKSPLRFGYLGRLNNEKGILPLAHFFSNNQYPFCFAGDGPLKDEILSILKSNKNSIYLGKINNDEIIQFFEQIDVLIIPSLEETGPLVGVEAMAAAKLIVSTDVGAMKERLVGLNSYWVDIQDEKSLNEETSQIVLLSEDEFREKMNANRERYLQQYQQEIIKNQYRELISSYVK